MLGDTKVACSDKFRQFRTDEVVPETFLFLTLKSDVGGDYDYKDFDVFCYPQVDKRELTALCSPHQNSVAESLWQTVGNTYKCLLKPANIPTSLWLRAVDLWFYLTNCCLSKSLSPFKTPFKFFMVPSLICRICKVLIDRRSLFFKCVWKSWTLKLSKNLVAYGCTHVSYNLCNQVTVKINRWKNVSFTEKKLVVFGAVFFKNCEFLPESRVL